MTEPMAMAALLSVDAMPPYAQAMELVGPFLLLAIGVVLVGGVLSAIKGARERGTGTGSWIRYGPAPSSERIAHVRSAERCWFQGLSAISDRSRSDILQPDVLDPKRATVSQYWTEAADMGDERAAIGLGILAHLDGEVDTAHSFWSDARSMRLPKSDAAKILQKLAATGSSASQTKSFAEAFLKAEGATRKRERIEAITEVRKTAMLHGCDGFAESYQSTLDEEVRATYN